MRRALIVIALGIAPFAAVDALRGAAAMPEWAYATPQPVAPNGPSS